MATWYGTPSRAATVQATVIFPARTRAQSASRAASSRGGVPSAQPAAARHLAMARSRALPAGEAGVG